MFAMSNTIISARYALRINDLKLLHLAFKYLSDGNFVETHDGIKVQFNTSEIKNNLGFSRNMLYTGLLSVATHLTNLRIIMLERTGFKIINIVTYAEYDETKKLFTLYFNNKLRNDLILFENRFTRMRLTTIAKFRSSFAIKLYDYLKPLCQANDATKHEIKLSLYEVRFILGTIDLSDKVTKIFENKNLTKEEKYKKAYENSEKKYRQWYNFRERVLETAVKEVNENSEINVSYSTLSGSGGTKEIAYIVFTYYDKSHAVLSKQKEKKEELQEERTEDEKMLYFMQASLLLNFCSDLEVEDIKKILEVYDYDMKLLSEKAEIAKTQKKIEDIVKWLIAAKKDDYKQSIPKKVISKNQNKFNDFEQRQYTNEQYKDLESALVKKNWTKS